MKVSLILLVIFGVCSLSVENARILGIFPHGALSHFKAFQPVLVGLAEAGHDVTVLSHFPRKSLLDNYHDIVLDQEEVQGDTLPVDEVYTPRTFKNYFLEFIALYEEGQIECEALLKSSKIESLFEINKEKPFDILLTEYFNTECALGIAYKLNISSYVGFSSCALMPWHSDRIGLPDTPSYIPNEFVGYSDKMTFYERLTNWIVTRGVKILYSRYTEIEDNRLLKAKFGDGIPDVHELAKNTELLFVNQHFSFSGPKPLPPNVIEIGGIHIAKTREPLPTDIKDLLDNAKSGVIYFSWGSHIKAESMPIEKKQGIVNALKRLPQTVLMKWEGDSDGIAGDNIVVKRWLPQTDILCHPNVKAFMSHGGLMGTTESVYCGVPVVATPIYGDQFLNAAALEDREMGVILHYTDITEKTVFDALQKVLNPRVKENAEQVSLSYRNRQVDPLQTAIWWIEYVVDKRTKNGGKLLKSHSVELNYFNYHSLDVILFLLCAMVVIIYLIVCVIGLLINAIKSIINKDQISTNRKRD